MPPLMTDTRPLTSDAAGALAALFTTLCRVRVAYALEPEALAELVSVLSAEVLGRLLAADAWAHDATVADALALEAWCAETTRRALAVAEMLRGENHGD